MKRIPASERKMKQLRKIKTAKDEKNEPLPNILNFFSTPLVVLDSQDRITLANDYMLSLTGYGKKELENEYIDKIFKINDEAFSLKRKIMDAEGVITTKTKLDVPVVFHKTLVKNEDKKNKKNIIHFIPSNKFKKHISSLSTSKDVLKEKINQKDKELKDINKTLKSANKAIEESGRALKVISDEMQFEEDKKSKYINEIVRQYKKPLNYIAKVSEILLLEQTFDEEAKQQFVNSLEDKVKILQICINFLYEWEREKMRGVKTCAEEVSVKEFIEEIESYLDEKSNQSVLKFHAPFENIPNILIDKRRLKDIFIQIVRDAEGALFSNKIDIKVNLNHQSNKVLFNITTTSAGIQEGYQLILFDKYSYLKDMNFSVLELNLPVFNDMLNVFGAGAEMQKLKNKESLIKIEVPVKIEPENKEEKTSVKKIVKKK